MSSIKISPELPPNDVIVLRNLADDIQRYQENADPTSAKPSASGQGDANGSAGHHYTSPSRDEQDLKRMRASNDPGNQDFEPSVICSADLRDLATRLHPVVYKHVLLPYIKWAQGIARHPRYDATPFTSIFNLAFSIS
ncbi:uncharacterized protein GGS25DRAFT_320267 [Hypoxylon fragiforme]|uniref:uncharacterized protein n=1 Tax=Hypoxylon fragiforme TaxID=63214 RepID=UPI0020C61D95|nr:uncharacterized protein GGS25DRAFT_320267 [Hypoxylon fragiforme]KAI2607127.1 hypothetical protein GGS25DRAFT_320267 [Hypoxylon fragiforme]